VTGACREEAEANTAETKTILEEMKTPVETGLEDVKAIDLEANTEEREDVAECQKVANEETGVELSEYWRTDMGTGI
jgi:hypothetical protein